MIDTALLTDEQRVERGRDLCKLIEMDIQDRRTAIRKRAVARNLYDGVNNRTPRYPGASNIHLPVIEEKVEGTVPKLVNAFFGAEPIVNVKREQAEFNPDSTENNERFLNWAVMSDIPLFYDTVESWFRSMLLDGVSVVKVSWERIERNTVEVAGKRALWDVGEFDMSGQPVEESRPRAVLEVFADHFPGLISLEGEGNDLEPALDHIGTTWTVRFIEDRRQYDDVQVMIAQSEFVDEVDLYIYRPIIVANRPCIEEVEYEDLIVPYRTWDLQRAPRVTHRYWLRLSEIKRKVETEGWVIDDEDWDKLRNAANTKDRHERDDNDRILSRQRDVAVGESPSPNRGSTLHDDEAPYVDGMVMIYEVYATDDPNGDGMDEEVIYHIPHCLEKVVRAQYLEELFPHGRRPFIDAHFIRYPDRWYSRSMGEQLMPINLEVDAIVNMVNEAQELINNPFFFYVPHSVTVDPGILENIEPGQGIPVSDANAVAFPKFNQEPLANLSAVDSMLLFADRLTIAPQAVGSSQVRNSPRTARGQLALLGESSIKTDIIITRLQMRPWKELFHQIHGLYGQFGDNVKWFRVTGEDSPRRITPEEMRGRFEYSFHGNSINTNREVKRTIAQMRYATLVTNPLYMNDLDAMGALIEDYLRHFSEGADIRRLQPKLPGRGGTHPPMDQKTENMIMQHGQHVEVLPTDDHVAHIAEIDRFSNTPAFDTLPEWAVTLIGVHKMQHLQYMQQLAAQGNGGVMPNGGGTANNLPAEASGDLSVLEGGVQ